MGETANCISPTQPWILHYLSEEYRCKVRGLPCLKRDGMASEVSETYDNQRDWLETEMSVRRQAQDEVAYEYLCRLEEAKK